VTDVRWQLAAYVFVSIILRIVAAQLNQRRTDIPWVRRLSEGWAASILRFAYFMGPPYVALILGVMPARYMGLLGLNRPQARQLPPSEFEHLSEPRRFLAQIRNNVSLIVLDWLPDVGKLAGLVLVVLLLLGVAWLGYRYFRWRILSDLRAKPSIFRMKGYHSVVQVAYQAVHWSFYRGAVWLLADDLYLGVVGGVVLVGVEWMLDAGWLHRTQDPLAGEPLRIDASILVATSSIFLFVPNLWLLLPVHWLLAKLSWWMTTLRQQRMTGDY
jgi:hypothetical protein